MQAFLSHSTVWFRCLLLLAIGLSGVVSSGQDTVVEQFLEQRQPDSDGNGEITSTDARLAVPAEWLVMVYMAADNNLYDASVADLQEMEIAGSSDTVKIAFFLDFREWVDVGHNQWQPAGEETAVRGLVLPDRPGAPEDIPSLSSENIESLGKKDSSDPQILSDFIQWAQQRYPARRNALILWSHGNGWRDLNDEIARGMNNDAVQSRGLSWIPVPGNRGVLNDMSANNSTMNMGEIRRVLENIPQRLDLVAFDACLMGMVEVAYEVRNVADYMVASEQNVPGPGYEYSGFLTPLRSNPNMTSREFGVEMLKAYDAEYGDTFDNTLCLVESKRVEALVANLDSLVGHLAIVDELVLQEGDWVKHRDNLTKARSTAGPEMGSDVPLPFIDLGMFLQRLIENEELPDTLTNAARKTQDAFRYAVLGYVHGQEQRRTGLSIFFPRDRDWEDTEAYSISNYTADNILFARDSKWPYFIEAFANNQQMRPQGEPVQGPEVPEVEYEQP